MHHLNCYQVLTVLIIGVLKFILRLLDRVQFKNPIMSSRQNNDEAPEGLKGKLVNVNGKQGEIGI